MLTISPINVNNKVSFGYDPPFRVIDLSQTHVPSRSREKVYSSIMDLRTNTLTLLPTEIPLPKILQKAFDLTGLPDDIAINLFDYFKKTGATTQKAQVEIIQEMMDPAKDSALEKEFVKLEKSLVKKLPKTK